MNWADADHWQRLAQARFLLWKDVWRVTFFSLSSEMSQHLLTSVRACVIYHSSVPA